jgi:hypothetical protein
VRAIVVTGPGKVELAWTWLPTFMGISSTLKKEIEEKLGPELIGQPLTDEVLDRAHERVLDIICARYSALVGLRLYLDGMKFIEG